jgi:hypothetical protein
VDAFSAYLTGYLLNNKMSKDRFSMENGKWKMKCAKPRKNEDNKGQM